MHQNWFRDYDPSIGRYLQSDPIGLRAGLSTYGYANQSPTGVYDPTGTIGVGTVVAVGTGVATLVALWKIHQLYEDCTTTKRAQYEACVARTEAEIQKAARGDSSARPAAARKAESDAALAIDQCAAEVGRELAELYYDFARDYLPEWASH